MSHTPCTPTQIFSHTTSLTPHTPRTYILSPTACTYNIPKPSHTGQGGGAASSTTGCCVPMCTQNPADLCVQQTRPHCAGCGGGRGYLSSGDTSVCTGAGVWGVEYTFLLNTRLLGMHVCLACEHTFVWHACLCCIHIIMSSGWG